MLNFSIDRIPIKINPCPIFSAVLEIRYLTSLPVELMVGRVYEKLQQNHNKNNTISLGELQRLPINDIPFAARNNDDNLRNQPHYVIDYNGLSFQVAMTSISVAIKNEYPGWEVFSRSIKDFIKTINLIEIIQVPLRIGFRCTSFFDFNIFERVQLELTLFNNATLEASNVVSTNWSNNDISCSLQVANNVMVSNHNETKQGSIIDIDVATKNSTLINVNKIDKILESLHDYEKKVFFNLLSDDLLKSLNPIYEEKGAI